MEPNITQNNSTNLFWNPIVFLVWVDSRTLNLTHYQNNSLSHSAPESSLQWAQFLSVPGCLHVKETCIQSSIGHKWRSSSLQAVENKLSSAEYKLQNWFFNGWFHKQGFRGFKGEKGEPGLPGLDGLDAPCPVVCSLFPFLSPSMPLLISNHSPNHAFRHCTTKLHVFIEV